MRPHARTACTRVPTGHPSTTSVRAPSHEESDATLPTHSWAQPLKACTGGITRGIGVMCTSQALIPRAHTGP